MKSNYYFMYQNFFKRIFDFVGATGIFLVLSPVFLMIAIILWIDFKGNPFFFQERPGKNEKIFKVVKFKTMNNKKDSNGELLSDAKRITKLGLFVRKTSLDEIPQLFNVIMGDMSLIGPRPLRTYYLPYYSKEESKRHSVRPGITGLAQVSGRNFLTWEERFSFDIEYVKDISFKKDMLILVETVKKVFSSSDVAVDQDEFIDSFHIYREKQIAKGTFKNE